MTDHTRHRTAATPAGRSPAPRELTAVRDHIQQLRSRGASYRSIAAAAGIGPMTVHDIAAGSRPATETAAAVLAVTGTSLASARLDAGGTRLRLRALHVMGHGSPRMARAAGVSEQTIRALVTGDARTVSQRLRDTIIELYEAWWDKRAPERSRAERAAASAARRRAIAGNWCAGAGLDDGDLDIPGYRPCCAWRPARGTGVATDFAPRPARKKLGLGA